MKTKPFTLTYPLVSTYVANGGLGTVHNGALLITGAYHIAANEPVIDHTHYELCPGTTLNDLMEWLAYNNDAQITEAVLAQCANEAIGQCDNEASPSISPKGEDVASACTNI